ncbi:MAG: outer membrane lipoprotein carrier protein LolA [bacterium]|nr:outer membrane lipoprotein carrier protein LolA [bacterium]
MLLASAAAGPLEAAELGEDQVLERLQQWLLQTRDLQGSFQQTLISGALGEGHEEAGMLGLERPGRMRWDYLRPERKVALLVDGQTWLYQAEDEHLILGDLPEGDLLAALLAGSRPLAELFEHGLLATPKLGGQGAYRLRLVPREGDDGFEQIVLTLRPPQFGIETVEVLDSGGNRMIYRFTKLKRNRGIAPERFTFEPPPGTLVSGEHAPGPGIAGGGGL